MKIDFQSLCDRVEAAEPSAHALIIPEQNQIIVRFDHRPDVEIVLLTPYLQSVVLQGIICDDDLSELLFSIRRIAHFQS